MPETPTPFDGGKGLGPMGRATPDAPEFRAGTEALQNKIDANANKRQEQDKLRKFASIRSPEETAELQKMIAEKLKELGKKI
ncbi:MAG: hypothetical protein PHD72_02585 [Patescibacteria group bacterium]|nr:hypothetical protein [Patescibacteria group bacterium]